MMVLYLRLKMGAFVLKYPLRNHKPPTFVDLDPSPTQT